MVDPTDGDVQDVQQSQFHEAGYSMPTTAAGTPGAITPFVADDDMSPNANSQYEGGGGDPNLTTASTINTANIKAPVKPPPVPHGSVPVNREGSKNRSNENYNYDPESPMHSPGGVEKLKEEMENLYKPIERDDAQGLKDLDQARKEIQNIKSGALKLVEKMGQEWEKDLKKRASDLKKNFDEVGRLQRVQAMREGKAELELKEKEEQWREKKAELEAKIVEVEELAEDRQRRKEILWRENKNLQQDLKETTEKKNLAEETLRSFSGKRAHCVVCQFINFNEKMTKKYEEANIQHKETIKELTDIRAENEKTIAQQTKRIADLEKQLKQYEGAHVVQAQRMLEMQEEIAKVNDLKASLREAEKTAKRAVYNYEELKTQAREGLEELEMLKPQVEVLTQKAEMKDAEIREKQRKIADLSMDLKASQQETKKTKEQVFKLEAKSKVKDQRLMTVRNKLLKSMLYAWGNDDTELRAMTWQNWKESRDVIREDRELFVLQRAHEKLTGEHTVLTEQHISLNARHDQLVIDHNDLTEKYTKVAEVYDVLKLDFEHRSMLEGDMRARYDDAVLRMDRLKDRLEFLEKSCEKKDERMSDFKLELQERNLKLREMERKIDALKHENEHLWAHQGITVCDTHLWKPKVPKDGF